MEFYRPKRLPLGIDMTPLIDCVFNLLLFFLLTSTYLAPTVALNLPRASAEKGASAQAVTVTLTASRDLFLNTDPIARDDLPRRLLGMFQQTRQRTVILHGPKAAIRDVLQVIALLQHHGAAHVHLAYKDVPATMSLRFLAMIGLSAGVHALLFWLITAPLCPPVLLLPYGDLGVEVSAGLGFAPGSAGPENSAKSGGNGKTKLPTAPVKIPAPSPTLVKSAGKTVRDRSNRSSRGRLPWSHRRRVINHRLRFSQSRLLRNHSPRVVSGTSEEGEPVPKPVPQAKALEPRPNPGIPGELGTCAASGTKANQGKGQSTHANEQEGEDAHQG